jgi:predicted nucleic acid-binding protein
LERVVVDASVAVKWFLPEIHSEAAERLLHPNYYCYAPELIVVECMDALRKHVRRSGVAAVDATQMVRELLSVVSTPYSAHLAPEAFRIAVDHGRRVYDSLYVALALQEGLRLVTADQRLLNAVSPAYPENMLWIEDLPELT